MDYDALSVSKINTYGDCDWKFALQYHLKLPELRKPTIYTEKGIAVHEVLELYANGDKDYEKRLIDYYKKSKLWKLDQRKPEKGGFPHPVDKTCDTCPWNNNGYCEIAGEATSTVDGCPRPNFEDDLALAVGVINREGDDAFLQRKILGAEVEFDEIIGGVRVIGVIDLVTEIDEDTIEIIDYKTGRSTKSNAALQKDPQVRVYNVIAKMKWPEYKYRIMTLDYLRKKPVTVVFSDEDDKLTELSVIRNDKSIRSNEHPKPLRWDSWLCKFCVGKDRCTKMHDSLKKSGTFKLPIVSCFYANALEPCWGSLNCINENELNDDLERIQHACQGHKEVKRGGVYIKEAKEEKPEEIIERD